MFLFLKCFYYAFRSVRFARRSFNALDDARYYFNKAEKYNNRLRALKPLAIKQQGDEK